MVKYVTILLVLAALCSNYARDSTSIDELFACIMAYKGDVKIQRNNQEKWIQAWLKMPLFENDKLKTGDNSSAKIVFKNLTQISIYENKNYDLKREIKISTDHNQQMIWHTFLEVIEGMFGQKMGSAGSGSTRKLTEASSMESSDPSAIVTSMEETDADGGGILNPPILYPRNSKIVDKFILIDSAYIKQVCRIKIIEPVSLEPIFDIESVDLRRVEINVELFPDSVYYIEFYSTQNQLTIYDNVWFTIISPGEWCLLDQEIKKIQFQNMDLFNKISEIIALYQRNNLYHHILNFIEKELPSSEN